MKKTGSITVLALDFDGVLHSYASGWRGVGACIDPPTPGALEFLAEAVNHFEVHIYSGRSHRRLGRTAMYRWLKHHLEEHFRGDPDRAAAVLQAVRWPFVKPAAGVFIDDRAMCFTGRFPQIDEIKNFRPWHERPVA